MKDTLPLGLSRRGFLAASGAAALAVGCANTGPPPTPGHDMTAMSAQQSGSEQIGMVMYPEMTAIDLVAPQYFLAGLLGATVHLVAKDMSPVVSDTGVAIMPTATFQTCPARLDVLFVPGGTNGTLAAIEDKDTLGFVTDRGGSAAYVTSVCTGSVILGAAGLLRGYRATSHWFTRPLLSNFGATPTDQRVVVDRNRITGAGVSAGLDFGLTMTALLRDESYARTIQLLAEYAPAPPFNAGRPEDAPQEKETLTRMFAEFSANAEQIAKRYAR
jgi:cyclohexyl-isocyanide hydratase